MTEIENNFLYFYQITILSMKRVHSFLFSFSSLIWVNIRIEKTIILGTLIFFKNYVMFFEISRNKKEESFKVASVLNSNERQPPSSFNSPKIQRTKVSLNQT
jgi:hypothetical protein